MSLEYLLANSEFTETECWLWKGAQSAGREGDRYGSVVFEGETKLVHRLAWELARGPIPPDLVIGHKCNTKRCCNPTHLELLTVGQNTSNAWRDGLSKPNRKANAVLDERKVDLIRALWRATKPAYISLRGWSYIVAPLFKVSSVTIRAVITGTTWGWYESPFQRLA